MAGTWKIIAAAALFLLAVREETAVRPQAETVTVFLETAVDGDRAEEICGAEAENGQGTSVCFWKEESGVEIFCRETGQNSRICRLFTEGNTELLLAGTSLLSWQQGSCYLDAETARKLFGTGKAEGQVVWSGDKSHTVRGTFESQERFMMCPARENGEAAFSACSLKFAEGGNLRGQAEQFLMRNALTGSVVEFTFLESLIRNLLLVFPSVLAVRLGLFLLEKKGKLRFLPMGALAVLTVWLLAGNLSVPADMIPTRWSDFSFWGAWWQSEKQNLLLILQSPMGAVHLELLIGLVKAAVYGVGAGVLIL